MRSHRRHPIGTGAARRRTTWARQVATLSNAAAGTYDTVDMLANFKTDGGTQQGVTVARIHLRLAVLNVVAAADQVAIGIIRGQNTDVGVTVAGAPEPLADPYEDWLWWSVFTADHNGMFFLGGSNNFEVDIRSKRKFAGLQESLNIVARAPVSGAFPQQVQYSASVLLMLP